MSSENIRQRGLPAGGLVLCMLALACGEDRTLPGEPSRTRESMNLTVTLPSLPLTTGSTVSSLRCLLLLITYGGEFQEKPTKTCTLSDATTVPVHREATFEPGSGDGPFSLSLHLKRFPTTIRIFAMDPADLEPSGEICSNQSIAALPTIPIIRVGESRGEISAAATSAELVIAKSQNLTTLPRLQSCR